MALAMAMSPESDGAATKGRQGSEDAGKGQDVYVKLKTLQKHMEFLDIQVGGVRGWYSRLWNSTRRLTSGAFIVIASVDFAYLSSILRRSTNASRPSDCSFNAVLVNGFVVVAT